MPHFGPWELVIILLIVLAIFGAGKLASLGGAVGKAVRDFRKEVRSGEEAKKAAEEAEKAAEEAEEASKEPKS